MLESLDGKPRTKLNEDRKNLYERIKNRMTPQDFDAIMNVLTDTFDDAAAKLKERYVKSSFVPGSDWTGTVYQPIYKASLFEADPNQAAAFMFGIMMWVAAMEHSEVWRFHKPDKDDDQPLGMLYYLPDL